MNALVSSSSPPSRSDQLKHNYNLKKYAIDVNLEHLTSFDERLVNMLNANPNELLPLVRVCVRVCVGAHASALCVTRLWRRSLKIPFGARFRLVHL